MAELCAVDIEGWKKEIADVRENHYSQFGDRLPKELYAELDAIEKRLNDHRGAKVGEWTGPVTVD
jgi:phosphoenolpyruvate carboxykinase (GTP)